MAICANVIRLAKRLRRARLTATGACDTPTHADITQKGTAAIDPAAHNRAVGSADRLQTPGMSASCGPCRNPWSLRD